MTPEQALQELNALTNGDPEADHGRADNILCELLRALGHGAVVDAYDAVEPKWYA